MHSDLQVSGDGHPVLGGRTAFMVAIGINQYHRFHPLNYAQQDAQAFCNFWHREMGQPNGQAILLNDASQLVAGHSTHPTRRNIEYWLTEALENCSLPESQLWLFFSGYGVCYQGKDYLMPIDGNPSAIQDSGLAVEKIVAQCQAAMQLRKIDVLLLLDMNRSQAIQAGATVGTQTLELAEKANISVILSCKPHQFSNESETLRHGFFTAVLLEGLRSPQSQTLSLLGRHLLSQLPKLSQGEQFPPQHPVVSMRSPSLAAGVPCSPIDSAIGDKVTILWFENGQGDYNQSNGHNGQMSGHGDGHHHIQEKWPEQVQAEATVGIFDHSSGVDFSKAHSNGQNDQGDGHSPTDDKQSAIVGANSLSLGFLDNSPDRIAAITHASDEFVVPTSTDFNFLSRRSSMTSPESKLGKPQSQTASSDDVQDFVEEQYFWRTLLLWGSGISLVMLLGIFWRNASGFRVAEPAAKPTATASPSVAPTPKPSPAPPLGGPAITATSSVLPTTSPDPGPMPSIANSASPPAAVGLTTQPNPPASPTASAALISPNLLPAFLALQNARPSEALRMLEQIPVEQHTPEYRALRTQVEMAANKTLLEDARTRIIENQASLFKEAIVQARKIQPGQPYYDQAQQDIRRWSSVIIDLAIGRAKSGNYDAAIKAAQLLIDEPSEAGQQAKQYVAMWRTMAQQQRENQAILRRSEGLIERGSASSYSNAIRSVRAIQPGQPLYPQAQQFIIEWSQAIWQIARLRADQGRIQDAINAARLVPANTPAYEAAQKALPDWQKRINQ